MSDMPTPPRVRMTFEMSKEQYDDLLRACRPVPYMIIGGVEPPSPQDNANAAWASLGRTMGFDYLTVQAAGSTNPRQFTAIPKEN